jgi:predicted cupin superfamily sugar epimerase
MCADGWCWMSKNSRPAATALIAHYHLEPLRPEGGHFAVTYRAGMTVTGDPAGRPLGGAILYMVTAGAWGFSALHKLPIDEVYHYYLGDPAELLLLHPDGTHETITLGPDVLNGQRVQVTVPAGVWQGSRVVGGGDYTLLGTTTAPAFMEHDYVAGDRATLTAAFPAAAAGIAALTR